MEPIRIMVLGMSGAGKTVYLASLYQRLSVQRDGYALTTDAAISARLSKAYNSVRDPALEWPRGTRNVDYLDIPFDCVINNPHGKFTVMKLLYLDYAGGILAADLDGDEFFKRLKSSDAFLVLIDGLKVLRALNGEGAAADGLEMDLDSILGHIQDHIHRPLHFVLTKWDVLDGAYSLHDVAALLSKNQNFQAIIEQRRHRRIDTRLIPVSAVGKGFARLSPDGQMIKVGGAKAKPENVDLPICCLLHDLILTAKARIEDERLKLGFLKRLMYRTLGSASILIPVAQLIVSKVPIPATAELVRHVLNSALTEIQKSADRSMEDIRTRNGQAVMDVKSSGDAFKALVEIHGHELYWLKKRFPASSLSESYAT
jgi:hypothetical protein